MKCLLVDDEAGIREGLALLLRRKGHEVHTAGTVVAALQQLQQRDFELVVTDWRLEDGIATAVVAESRCPVVVVSGHPEEVTPSPRLLEVLTKPLAPAALLQLLAEQARAAPGATKAADASLPVDVADAIAAALALLGNGTASQIDDGTFVTLRVRSAAFDDTVLAALERLGGDLRVLSPGGQPTVELRLFRDGRPAADTTVVDVDSDWPEAAELALDFARASPPPPARFLQLLDRAAASARAGQRVHFLNVPGHLRFFADVSGRGHDMPKRTVPGPRLPAVLAHLWS